MSLNHERRNPFRVGDCVVYAPSYKGYMTDVNAPKSERLTPGGTYRVAKIQDEDYVLVEGYDHPGGGIYWSEFQPASRNDSTVSS